jgi:hypothetical protein
MHKKYRVRVLRKQLQDIRKKIQSFIKKTLRSINRKLVKKFPIIAKVRKWKYYKKLQKGLAIGVLAITAVGLLQLPIFAAPDLNDTWTFSNPSEYNHSSGVEINSGIARLKARNYTSDTNTRALYHFDESGGTNISDASPNNNNATLHGGLFTTGNLNNGISLSGNNEFASANNSNSLKLGQQQTIEGWTKFNNNFSAGSSAHRQGIVDKGDYQLYYDNETGKVTYELADSNANTWTPAGGNDIKNSWDTNGKRSVNAYVKMGSDIYAGIGVDTGDAEVWKWDGTNWSQIGGGATGINGSWVGGTYEGVYSLATDGTHIYAGLGNGTGDGEVWRWDGSNWTKIGGDSINGGWTNYAQGVYSLDYFGGKLYAGLGYVANNAEVWEWDGSSWTKIGGDSVNGGWTTNFESVLGLTNDGTNLYAGIGSSANDAEVWKWNGSTWTKIGGDSINGGWTTNYESVRTLKYFGGKLYAGLGDSASDAEVWEWDGSTWTKIGGDSINGGWTTNYDLIGALAWDGSNLYAGLGVTDGEGEVWKWDGSNWTKIGGDSVNGSWTTAQGDTVNALFYDSSRLYAGTYDAGGEGMSWTFDGSSWTEIGGTYINNSWGYFGTSAVQVMQKQGDYLYAGLGATNGSALVWRFDGTNWQLVGGQGVHGSWAPNTYESVLSMASYGGDVYVGLGSNANDAEVWKWDGSTWTKIGGDSINSGWTTNYEEVNSLASYGGYLYAGLGNSATDGEVWRWDGSSWTKIGGDSINSGWTNYADNVYSMAIYDGKLVVGLGRGTGEAELWQWDGSAWTKIGGDSVAGSWNTTTYQSVESLMPYNGKLYAGLGNVAGSGTLWEYDGSTWTKVGGDDVNGSWTTGSYERVKTMAVYNGDLYAGLGYSAGDGEVWRLSDNTWTKIGGTSINGGWSNQVEEIESMSAYKGKFYVGTGLTQNLDALVWSWGNNTFVQSNQSSFDTNWHHVAATYDGSTAKIFIDGAQDASTTSNITVDSKNRDLLIGKTYGGREFGKPVGHFDGKLDEIRLSDTVRSGFNSKPYANTPQTVELADSVRKSGVWHWDTLSHTDIPNGGSITYRLSDDDGSTWKYWDGLAWTTSNSLSETNTPAIISAHFDSFPVTFKGMKWQAVLSGNGNQQVSLDGVSAMATSDTVDPTSNPSNLAGYKANGGSSITPNGWTNGSSPYFTWDPGNDDDSGIRGYCAYLGTDPSADPITTKGMLGTSPEYTNSNCQFIVSGNTLDLATPGLLGTPLSSSNDTLYLSLRTIDKAGNVTNLSSQFAFKFDNTAPSNPGFITAPSGFINTKDVEMSWPTSGGSAPSDANSGIAGLQYRIGPGGTWYGDVHNGSGDSSDLLANDGLYATIPTPDHNDLTEGINTVYFRTWDQAGNYTTSYATATLKINTSGAPSEPNNLTASPPSNTSNSFGFNWDEPTTYVGNQNNITYCYTVNTVPSASSCVYTAPGSTELTVGPYATQPGTNTLYVVARDESSNINYLNYSSVTFSANTSAPGVPRNTDIVDVSIKNTNNWRLALTWAAPTNIGSGVSSYNIYRSTDNSSFSKVGTSTSTTYIDAGLNQIKYFYKVTACDNTNNCGAPGSVVNETPTGKFTSPALLMSGPSVSGITTKRASISWSTDRVSDSKIIIGTKSGKYSSSEVGNSAQVSSHKISLDNLSPGTTYYYKAKWTDEDGNTGTSQEQTFTTAPAPIIKETSISNISLSGANVSFTVKGATRAKIYYGTSDSFGGLKQINTSTSESRYQIDLGNLSDGTKYYVMVSSQDQEGGEYRGSILTFTTPSRPRITNLRFQPVAKEPTSTQRVTWTTNVPTTSQVSYSTPNGRLIEIQDSKMVTEHEITIRNLQDDSVYSLIASSRDRSGNLATSDKQSFRTALDTRPPTVSNIVVKSSIRGSGTESRGQLVVSWQTDEPSASQVAYSEGSGVKVFNSKSAEDTKMTTEHIIIISDLPTSRVYSVQPLSKDKSKNEGQGEVQTAIIGRASDSAITIIFNTLKSIFGL